MARVASTLSALGNGLADGEVAYIRVSEGGEPFTIRLTWDLANNVWVSEPIEQAITSTDGDWTGVIGQTSLGDWQYWGYNASDLGKWNLAAGAIPFAGALFAAGLKLQDRISARMFTAAGAGMMLAAWFYEYEDGDSILFSNDTAAQGGKTWAGHADQGFHPSKENIGHGAVLLYDGSGASRIHSAGQYDDGIVSSPYHSLTRNPGWDYVKFFLPTQPVGAALGGVPTNTPYTPVKKHLYPTLYGRQWNGQGAASIVWECRWTS